MHWKKAITPYVVIFSKKELNTLEKYFNHNTKPELSKGQFSSSIVEKQVLNIKFQQDEVLEEQHLQSMWSKGGALGSQL
jgi:hypothetical protein